MGSPGPPPAPTRFIGRDADVAAVTWLLSDQGARLVTVTGPAGVGKTRLAVEVGYGRRVGDVVFVALADVDDPARFPAALVASLGGADAATRAPLDVAVDIIGDRDLLVVLDNFEHLVAAARDVAHLVAAAPRVTVLVTSRRPLGVRAERCVVLGPLAVPADDVMSAEEAVSFDAVALFVARLEAADARYRLDASDVPDIVRICRRLDGLPLALELAAARARSLPLDAIADAIDARIDILGPAAPDLPDRHRTLSAAVQWSVDLLTPAAARLFRRLSVHAGATIDAVTAIGVDLGLERREVLDALDELVAQSLVVQAPGGRYRMLEIVRDAGLRQLETAGDTATARARHARWYLDFAEEVATRLAGDQQSRALDSLQAEASNLSSAARHALGTHDSEVALRICRALRMLWYVRGSIAEGRTLFARALELDGQPGRLRTAAMIEAAALARHQGDLATAEALTRDAEADARRMGDAQLLASALLQRGFVLHLARRWDDAHRVLEESLALSEESGDRLSAARASHHLGFVAYFGYADVTRAWDLQRRCLAVFRDLHNERHVATALVTMIELARARGDRDAARDLASEAAHELRRLRDTPLLIHALHEVAALAADEGRPTLAVRLLGAAEGLAVATGAAPWPVVAAGARRWLDSAAGSVGRRRAEGLRVRSRNLDTEEALDLLDLAASGIPDPAALTRREQEVAGLVADGLTNRAIAEKLFLSERTVDGHVARALTKLGLRNRAQLAAHLAGGD